MPTFLVTMPLLPPNVESSPPEAVYLATPYRYVVAVPISSPTMIFPFGSTPTPTAWSSNPWGSVRSIPSPLKPTSGSPVDVYSASAMS